VGKLTTILPQTLIDWKGNNPYQVLTLYDFGVLVSVPSSLVSAPNPDLMAVY